MADPQQERLGQRPTDGSFREFALSLYRRDGVARAALALQDRRNVDVNVLLYGAYLAVHSDQLIGRADIEAARERTVDWQSQVVTPLRSVQRLLKSMSEPGSVDLRTRIQEAELRAEFLELDKLSELADRWQSGVQTARVGRIGAALSLVVTVYAGVEPTVDDHADIAALATQAAAIPRWIQRST